MGTQQTRRPIPNIRFRVLIIGRANAGKTSILQRVCDTTDSPIVYRGKQGGKEEVRGPTLLSSSLDSFPTRLNLTRPWMFVAMILLFGCF
jgi:GTPase SAR1 family protein